MALDDKNQELFTRGSSAAGLTKAQMRPFPSRAGRMGLVKEIHQDPPKGIGLPAYGLTGFYRSLVRAEAVHRHSCRYPKARREPLCAELTLQARMHMIRPAPGQTESAFIGIGAPLHLHH